MNFRFPRAIPEIPVSDLQKALDYYESCLGFQVEFGREEGNIAGISKGHCRMFLTDTAFREQRNNQAPVLVWLNLDSTQEVDELYKVWKDRGALVLSSPELMPWNLHEFLVADPDGNQFRIFYDVSPPVDGSCD